jgi:hypothetical protein
LALGHLGEVDRPVSEEKRDWGLGAWPQAASFKLQATSHKSQAASGQTALRDHQAGIKDKKVRIVAIPESMENQHVFSL